MRNFLNGLVFLVTTALPVGSAMCQTIRHDEGFAPPPLLPFNSCLFTVNDSGYSWEAGTSQSGGTALLLRRSSSGTAATGAVALLTREKYGGDVTVQARVSRGTGTNALQGTGSSVGVVAFTDGAMGSYNSIALRSDGVIFSNRGWILGGSTPNGSYVETSGPVATAAILRIQRSSGVLTMSYSLDNGTSWTTLSNSGSYAGSNAEMRASAFLQVYSTSNTLAQYAEVDDFYVAQPAGGSNSATLPLAAITTPSDVYCENGSLVLSASIATPVASLLFGGTSTWEWQPSGTSTWISLTNGIVSGLGEVAIGTSQIPSEPLMFTSVLSVQVLSSQASGGRLRHVLTFGSCGQTQSSDYIVSVSSGGQCTPNCDDIDFNNNGVFPEDQDVIDFLDVLAGGSPATCDSILGCNDIDFNNNTVFPEDQDVVSYFNVLAGGSCP